MFISSQFTPVAHNDNQRSFHQKRLSRRRKILIEDIVLLRTCPEVNMNQTFDSLFLSAKTICSRNEYAQAHSALFLIEDPLWKRVCGEILTLMGPIASQLFQVQLGVPQDKTMDIYCHTEELLPFLHTYQFVILAALQRYFPFLRTVDIVCNPQIA